MFKTILKACTALSFVASVSAAAFAGTVSVSSPANGSTVGAPMHVVATASSSAPVSSMRVYVDGVSLYLGYSSRTDTYINVGPGTHSVVVQAWDSTGAVFKTPLTVNVAGASAPAPTPTAPSGARTYADIDQMGGWDHCDKCSGIGANGPTAAYSMQSGISNPSMDGKAAQFNIASGTPFASAIWWKQLGANDGISHYTYDLYFYVKNLGAAFALEFDTNQTVGGLRYIMGTQCGVNYDKQWDVWDAANSHWIPTGAPCTNVQAYQWNHLTVEGYRANGRTYYTTITLNGQKNYINRNYAAHSMPGSRDLNVAFQMDMNGGHQSYNAWLDRVQLTTW